MTCFEYLLPRALRVVIGSFVAAAIVTFVSLLMWLALSLFAINFGYDEKTATTSQPDPVGNTGSTFYGER